MLTSQMAFHLCLIQDKFVPNKLSGDSSLGTQEYELSMNPPVTALANKPLNTSIGRN